MLSELVIRNIAIIQSETVSFSDPYTVLTGETGAGKSIILDALELALGSRADRELVRHGEEKASVCAIFTGVSDEVLKLAASFDVPVSGDDLILSRDLTAAGQSTAKINGHPVPVFALRDVGNRLLSIHGQHAGMYLLDPDNHISILDSFADTDEAVRDYRTSYDRMRDIHAEIGKLTRDEKEKARRIEMLKFQMQDIDAVSPKVGEEAALEQKIKLLTDAERIEKYAKLIYRALYRNEKGLSAADLLDKSAEAAEALADVLPESAGYVEKLNDFRYQLEDIAETVYQKCHIGDENPTELLDKCETRLESIKRLERKYGSDIEEILKFRKDAEAELHEIETADDRITELSDELKTVKKVATEKAAIITEKRKQAAAVLAGKIVSELTFLEMENVQFEIAVRPSDVFLETGCNTVEFLVSANKGEPLLPLAKIASGGEVARIMLALKCAMADKEKTPTLIFDEIDTGISGKTSYKIGVKLRQSSATSQIICITHSAQIAATASRHLLVYKQEEGERTCSHTVALEPEDRVKEIARIIGGEKITEKAVSAAREMLSNV